MNCGKCRFWEKTDPGCFNSNAVGECHKNPPPVVILDGKAVTLFPSTIESAYCGQYERRKTDKKHMNPPPGL